MDNISDLIGGYLDGELDDPTMDRLYELLRDSVAATDELVVSSYIHSQLIDLMSRRRVQGSVAVDAFTDEVDAEQAARTTQWAEGLAAAQPSPEVRSERQAARFTTTRSRFRHGLGLAAAVLVAAAMFTLAYWSLSRPMMVAQLTRSVGCKWQGPEGDVSVGTLLPAGRELDLNQGRALVTFTSGAQVVLEGPTRLRLVSGGSAEMSSGRITTTVPTQAIGFTITSPLARFIDLGTEFGLKVNAAKGFELNVFDGLVELQFVELGGQSVRKPLRISEITAIRYNAETGEITSGVCDLRERISL